MPFYQNLWFKLLLRISIILLVVVGASFYFLIHYNEKDLINNEIHASNQLSEAIKASLNHGMLKNDSGAIQDTIDAVVMKDKEIITIDLYDKQGKIKYSSDKSRKGMIVDKEKDAACLICHGSVLDAKNKSIILRLENGRKILRNVNPIENLPSCQTHHPSGKLLGNLVIDMSTANVDNQLKNQFLRMLFSSTVAFIVLAALLFAAITLFVTCPLKDLMKSMVEAAKGNLNIRAEVKGEDEIGNIARAFNIMVDRINDLHGKEVEHEKELTKAQQDLRYKAELENLNLQLKNRVKEVEQAYSQIKELLDEIQFKNVHLEKIVDRLKVLNRISISLSSVVDVDDIIKMIVDKAVDVMKAKVGSLMLMEDGTELLKVKYAIGLSEQVMKNTRVKVGEGISGWVAKNGKPLLVTDIEKDERFQFKAKAEYETKSLVSTPVIIKDNVIGVLNVNNKIDGSIFTHDELDLLTTLAGQTAVALENARLYDDLKKSYFDTIRALVNAIEAKDSYTKGHSERVRQTALEIANAMSLSDTQKEILQHAAVLHDIGKIGTDLKILHKKGKLTDEEFEAIQEHPLIGEQILEPIGFLKEVKVVISQHHERADGRGYPHGLSLNELSIESRIISVADAYDAMTSNRPYRETVPVEKVIDELKKNSGTQFDSEVVNVFIRLLQDKKAVEDMSIFVQNKETTSQEIN